MPTALPIIALIGNPNAGKTSLFNHLTGLNQKVGNFPGVTVDKKTGTCALNGSLSATIIDLPGTYSLYPRSLDERVVLSTLTDSQGANYPSMAVVVVDVTNLRRNLLLFTQVKDMGLPMVLALNMMDVAEKEGLEVDQDALSRELEVPVVAINARTGQGIEALKQAMLAPPPASTTPFVDTKAYAPELVNGVQEALALNSPYQAFQLAQEYGQLPHLSTQQQTLLNGLVAAHPFEAEALQAKETMDRYARINGVVANVVHKKPEAQPPTFTSQIDRVLTHKVWGYAIFAVILLLIFQAIFSWASWPMDLIDLGFGSLGAWLQTVLPPGTLTDLLTEGIIAGLGGVVIFVPQIAILFAFIALLEETGYMARVVFLMDKIMRRYGLSGKSVVPLISGVACAIPAIMAARNIEHHKDRLLTIFVTPFMACSARLPVYALLIALVIPPNYIGGFLSVQGLVLMGLYLLGVLGAIGSAALLKLFISAKEKSYLVMELPKYKVPRWKNVGLTILEKVKTFTFEAGKVIMAISIILWVLATYGPAERMAGADAAIQAQGISPDSETYGSMVASYKLENSYAGIFGKTIEPAIAPLGFDWKIGIALITSFAAREVFVGTLNTIYSIGESDDEAAQEESLKARLMAEQNPVTGLPMYSLALGISLMVFYAFAMQCMSTLAIVYRETRSWKWPLAQLFYMTGLAYVCSLIAFSLLG